MPDRKLPEEFAPVGPKLSRFPIRPAPPIRPHLFTEEARFARRMAVLAGATEAVAWIAVTKGLGLFSVLLVAFRGARPLWARAGTKIPRPALTVLLLMPLPFAAAVATLGVPDAVRGGGRVASLAISLLLAALALPALGDVCAACIADRVTIERRATAYVWLDIGTALGVACGAAIARLDAPVAGAFILLAWAAALFCSRGLRDRGLPRSSWPIDAYRIVLLSPLGSRLALSAVACGCASAWAALVRLPASNPAGWAGWLALGSPFIGMAVATRAEPLTPNALSLPLAATAVALAGAMLHSPALALAGLGAMLTAIPAAVARAAPEMDRALLSSIAWSALFAGAAAGAMLGS